MHPTRFDLRVLRAAYETNSSEITDISLENYGIDVYGPGWAGEEHEGKYYTSFPRINLSLGRLRKLGLVEQVGKNAMGDGNWSYWALTELGKQLLQASGMIDSPVVTNL